MDDVRPPFVKFEIRQLEDRDATIANGFYTTKDIDFIILIPHGSEGKQSIELPFADWLEKIRPQVGVTHRAAGAGHDTPAMAQARFPHEWLDQIKLAYGSWKKGEALPEKGAALKLWPLLAPSQLQACLGLHILTVEALAEASDDAVERLGMGGHSLRAKARDWLKAQKDPSNKVVEELAALRAQLSSQASTIAALEEKLAEAKKGLAAARAPVEA